MLSLSLLFAEDKPSRTNIVLLMADDQGVGEVGYYEHPVLKTPHLDAMAASGLRFDRFYAASAVCSPTRASVLTGRNPLRCGVPTAGAPLNQQERTLAQVLKEAGYRTGHFGKWHLNGKSSSQPITKQDSRNPGAFGLDEWASVGNLFNLDPKLSVNGEVRQFQGDGSDVVVGLANEFIGRCVAEKKSFFAVVWYSSPHRPHQALASDRAPYLKEDTVEADTDKGPEGKDRFPSEASSTRADFYGEMAALDRSVGTLRARLRDLGVADDTLVWYCSDNGGLSPPLSTRGLKGRKGQTWEGGLRVPGIIEWPRRIQKAAVTSVPCSTMDIFPTIVSLLGLENVSRPVLPLDGQDISSLFTGEMREHKPIPFSYAGNEAVVDGRYKLHRRPNDAKQFLLYDLEADPGEEHDLEQERPEVADRLKGVLEKWNQSVEQSLKGQDYKQEQRR